jgi:acyl dehydratase
MRCWEDFSPGQSFDLGTHTVTEAEIVEFAERWDPQPFHVDPVAAVDTPFGGLIASGWHTACIAMRLYVDAVLADAASHGSPGLTELRWLRPVRPGTTLHARLEVEEVQPSSRRPDRGTVMLRWVVTDDTGDEVLTMRGRGLFGRREPAAT